MRRLVGIIALAYALLLAMPSVAAAQTDEVIREYDVHATIAPDGAVTIDELIRYDFGTQAHHGIFRDIVRLEGYDTGKDRRYEIDVQRVTMDGENVDYAVSDEGNFRQVKIGDPDEFVTLTHDYRIRYTVKGALTSFAEHDELFWDAIGNGWSVPIDRAVITVESPAPITQYTCFRGEQGSRLPCASSTADGSTATFRDEGLFPHEGITTVVAIPQGVIQPPPEVLFSDVYTVADVFAVTPETIGYSGGILIIGLAGIGWLAWRKGRDRRYVGSPVDVAMGNTTGIEERVPVGRHDAGPVEYVPPDGILPGQLGTLIDEQANLLDVTATIVDLAVRKHLRIVEVEESSPTDYDLEQLDGGKGELLPYERELYGSLFNSRRSVRLSSLKYEFLAEIKAVQRALQDDVVRKGWYRIRPERTKQVWMRVGFVLVLAGIVATFIVGGLSSFGIVPLAVVLVGLVMCFMAKRMPARTGKGYAMLSRVRGFRRLFDEGDEDLRQRYAEQQGIFSQYLPYAVVFGCTAKWARVFEGLDDQALGADGWYTGSQPFTSLYVASAINHFDSAATGTLYASAPTSSSASGFSGGFSGGGFGGGGGGSW